MAGKITGAEPLRVLLVEDSEPDAALLERALREQSFDPRIHRIETEDELQEALDGAWEVVIADYSVPGCGALRALALVKERAPDLPVIVVSGSARSEELVGAMKAGASDYAMKDNFSGLGPAIRRELRDAGSVRNQRETERARRAAEERFRFVVENTGEVLYRLHFDTMTYDYIGPAWTLGEWSGRKAEDFWADYLFRTKSGELRWLSDHSS